MTDAPIPEAFFELDGEWFRPTAHCRGPWDADACHAGPPTGLLARASENALPDQRLVRIVVDLQRPIPFAGFRVEAEVTRAGRMVSSAATTIIAADNRVIATSRTIHIAAREQIEHPTAQFVPPRLADSAAGPFPIGKTNHGLPCFSGDGITVRYPPGHNSDPGPTTMWMSTVPLIRGETPSPFQSICPLADCGNAVSNNNTGVEGAAINADLTIALHREPVGDWFGSKSESYWEPDGIGISDSLLFDQTGAVGRAVQTLIVGP